MPYQITWKDNNTAIDVAFSGWTSDKEVLQVIQIAQGDPRFDTLRSVLHDFTGIDGCTHSASTLEDIGALSIGASLHHPNLRIAVVTDRADVIDMIRAFKGMGLNAYPMQIFSIPAAARIWLRR